MFLRLFLVVFLRVLFIFLIVIFLLSLVIKFIKEMFGVGICIVLLFNLFFNLGNIRDIVLVVLVEVGMMFLVVV